MLVNSHILRSLTNLIIVKQVNVIANILLLAAKCMAAYYSSSLSLIASLIDSALDLLCTVIVWTTNRLVKWQINRLSRQFPVGRRRLEPIGILVFSVIMVIAFVQVLQESVVKMLPGPEKKAAELPLIAVGSMGGTVIVKGIIWFGCIRIKTTQVQALAQGEIIPSLRAKSCPTWKMGMTEVL